MTTRRTLLAALVGAGPLLAGCSTEAEGPPDGAVHLFNQTNFSRRVRVRVSTSAGESLLEASFEVAAGSRRTSAVVLTGPGVYEVVATSDGDRSSRTLSFPAAADGAVRGYVRVAVSRDGVLVSRAGLT